MKSIAWIVISLIAATALAGCTGSQPPAPTGNPTSVTVSQSPASAQANSQVSVCWRVDGSGTIPHTALHTDTTSHPGSAGFADYKGTTYYPANATAASNVNIPGEFCTGVNVGTETLYFRAHAMTSAPGVITAEKAITVTGSTAVIAAATVQSHNQTAPPSSTVTVCWTVAGTGHIPHTAIHTDTTKHTTATSFADYKGTPYYPNNRTSQDPAGYDLPGNFCTGLAMPANGTLYFRAHAMTNPPGVMSTSEDSIAVNGTTAMTGTALSVAFVGTPPATAPRDSIVPICIRVGGTGTIPHIAVHTDSSSHATELTDFGVYKGQAYYPDNTTALNSSGYETGGKIHCTGVKVPSALGQSVFIRGHAMDAVLGPPGRLTPSEVAVAAS